MKSDKFMRRMRPVPLERHFNAAILPVAGEGRPGWPEIVARGLGAIPGGDQILQGIPFKFGPLGGEQNAVIALGDGVSEVRVPLEGRANYICVAHFCGPGEVANGSDTGEKLGEYVVRFARGRDHVQPVRRRFEVHVPYGGWGGDPFAAVRGAKPDIPRTELEKGPWGFQQTGLSMSSPDAYLWIYALEVPKPDRELEALVLRCEPEARLAVFGITLYEGPGHPLRYLRRRTFKVTLPDEEKVPVAQIKAEMDMGVVTSIAPAWPPPDDQWLNAPDKGLGALPRTPDEPTGQFLVEATGAAGAVLSIRASENPEHRFRFGEALENPLATSEDGRGRIEVAGRQSTWVHVTVRDAASGRPTPTRVHFRGAHGEYLAPYGHHSVVNDGWFEDYAGDLRLGNMNYAYVPGSFQIELPVGDVYVELSKGFEYEPVRRRVEIRPGQRELDLEIRRNADFSSYGWMTADTHVHFISPQTAWLEGQCEGLNLINLLASQWGRLFTSVADISGDLSGCSKDDTLVWVGTENRHHMLGHISLLGTRGDPVFPMCTGGPTESWHGDPDMMTLTDWARACREREGVVIRPHFPNPSCEEPVYIALEQLDGCELRFFADPASGSLNDPHFAEWYRYLNCGYRVAAVGGTDKMSAGMPVGGVRTYARLGTYEPLTFQSWARAVRSGRTFTTSGPLLEFTVDGHEIGDEIRMGSGGGTVEAHAVATSLWPMHRLEIVVNGKVAAFAVSEKGAKRLEIRQKIKVPGSCWMAARCGSKLDVHHVWRLKLGAHTSPIYVVAGNQEIFNPGDASYMLTLIDGGLTWLDTLSVRYDDERHRRMKAVFEAARKRVAGKMHAHGAAPPHSHPHPH